MVLLRLTQIRIMSKNNKNNDLTSRITLTDPDTGVTLSVPESNVTNHEYDESWNETDYTITLDSNMSDTVTYGVGSGIFSDTDFNTIFERPSEKHIRKRYTSHKKVDNVSDIGIHTLEKMSKRGEK